MLELVSPANMASMLGLTFREFLEECQIHRKLLQTRYAEARLPADAQDFLVNYPYPLHWVIIVEEENPDTVAILPVLKKMVDCTPRFNLYIVPAESDFSYLEPLLEESDFDDDLSEMEFPLLMLFDDEWALQTFWGPRPESADGYLEKWLEDNPTYEQLALDESPDSQSAYVDLLAQLTQEMRLWYNSGLQSSCVKELCSILETFQEQSASDGINEFENELD